MVEGIKGPEDSSKRARDSSLEPVFSPNSTEQKMFKAMHTPVKTLGDLKKVLIDNLGKENGTKMYNHFLQSLAESMLSMVRQSAQRAEQASKDINKQQQ